MSPQFGGGGAKLNTNAQLAELSLLVVATFLTFSSTSPSSLCETLSNSEIATSFDLFGWSVEACEEQWRGLFSTLTVCLAAITIVRGCCALKVLQFYTALSKRGSRKSLSINTRDRHASDNGTSRDVPSPSSGKRPSRIFLLPSPVDGFTANLGADLPLLSVTPSSPSYTSFPPPPAAATSPTEQKYVVYAPVRSFLPRSSLVSTKLISLQVLMSADEARKLQAKEVVFSRPRSRSQVTASPISSQPPSASTRSDLPIILEPEDEMALGKGKQA